MDLALTAFATLVFLSPLDMPRETLPGWDESSADRAARYASIAGDVAAVAVDACALSKDAPKCERWSVGVLLGVAWHESGFAPDVDAGRCYRGRDGKGQRCDSGRAVSMWQIQTGGEERDLFAHDRRAAARAALRRVNRSIGACRSMSPDLRLTAYAWGRCSDNGRAAAASRELWASIRRALAVQ